MRTGGRKALGCEEHGSSSLRRSNWSAARKKEREAEQVRTRIARDIHDEIGSELTKIALLGSEAESKLGSDVAGARVTLTRIRGLSKEVGIALGDVVWAVDPVHDTVKGLFVPRPSV